MTIEAEQSEFLAIAQRWMEICFAAFDTFTERHQEMLEECIRAKHFIGKP